MNNRHMIHSLSALGMLCILASCVPYREDVPVADLQNKTPPAAKPPAPIAPPVVAAPSPIAEATVPRVAPRFLRYQASGITFEGVSFDARSHTMKVVDQAAGPDSEFPDAASAGKRKNAIAAINGGFFDPQGNPLGIVISNGKRAGTWNAGSSICSGVWSVNAAGQSSIQRREALGKAGAMNARELLQAGPMLLDHGSFVSGLNATQTRTRSVLLWDGKSRWWMGCTSPCTLAALSAALERASPAGWRPLHALNLDGGSSSDLWVSSTVAGGPQNVRSFFSKPVRNFLVLVPKS